MFAKKSRNIINLISLISLFGLLVSAASLVVILSGFNGIQKYVEDVYGKFSASLYIYPQTGKFIQESDSIFSKLQHNNQVKYYSKPYSSTDVVVVVVVRYLLQVLQLYVLLYRNSHEATTRVHRFFLSVRRTTVILLQTCNIL